MPLILGFANVVAIIAILSEGYIGLEVRFELELTAFVKIGPLRALLIVACRVEAGPRFEDHVGRILLVFLHGSHGEAEPRIIELIIDLIFALTVFGTHVGLLLSLAIVFFGFDVPQTGVVVICNVHALAVVKGVGGHVTLATIPGPLLFPVHACL